MTEPLTTPDPADWLAMLSARARRRLEEAPALVEYIRGRRVPFGAAPIGQQRSGTRTPPAPLSVGAVDDADQVFVDLTEWVRRWAEALSVTTASIRMRQQWAPDGVHLGFAPSVSEADAHDLTRDLTQWLLAQHTRIEQHPDAAGYFQDVAHLVEGVYSRFPTDARPVPAPISRACRICGEHQVTVDWRPDADVRDVTVFCRSCTHVFVSTDDGGQVQQREHAKAVREVIAGSTIPRTEGAPA